jgi:putative pyruvate formate lyase activating enzyme
MSNLMDLSNCTLCPRECRVNRTAGELGFCGIPAVIRAARAALMYYEEPCISGSSGSGAVFFTGCSLGCVFCQNAAISSGLRAGASAPVFSRSAHTPSTDSHRNASDPAASDSASFVKGVELSAAQLSDVMLRLQEQGAANINLVTPSHVLHVVIPALEDAKAHGLSIPVVYNTSSYEKADALRLLDGLIDIYLPDLKYHSESLAASYSHAPNYPETARAAIAEMVRQCPEPLFADGSHSLDDGDETPPMKRGVIVRHMVMPGHTEDSKAVIQELYQTYGDHIFLSILNQYTPMPQCKDDPLLSRPVTKKEYDEVVDFAISLGVQNGFLQEGGTISQSFIPTWDGTGLTEFSQ